MRVQCEGVIEAKLGADWADDAGLVLTTSLGTMFHPDNANRKIYEVCDASGLPRFFSHSCRRIGISLRLASGEKLEVVNAIAGHSRPSTAIDLYRTVYAAEKQASVFDLGSFLGAQASA